MAINSNNETAYLVLDSLAGGSKYGLEIIEYISAKTNENVILKKPTLYSCLTRMERKGFISSSFWGESEFGGKRHYYTITKSGRECLKELEKDAPSYSFNSAAQNIANYNLNADFASNQVSVETQEQSASPVQEETSSPTFLQQDNLFNLLQPQSQPEPTKVEETENELVENQIDIFSFAQSQQENAEAQEQMSTQEPLQNDTLEQSQTEQQPESEVQSNEDLQKMEYYEAILQKDDGKLLKNDTLSPDQEEQNRRLYDTSSELKKYRKRKSFSENQIEMAVEYETEEDLLLEKQRLQELKQSMLSARESAYPQESQNQFSTRNLLSTAQNTPQPQQSEETEQPPVVDDAVFITSRIQTNEIPVQKRITPTNIQVDVSDDNLPAPRRNSNLEPTYKDMMSKLFERKKETPRVQQASIATPNDVQIDKFAEYGTLKNYYHGHGIEFKEYNKSSVQKNHNTNFLNFTASLVLLALCCVSSVVLFGILYGCKVVFASSSWLFYTIPILFAIASVALYIRHKFYASKKATFIYSAVVNWAVFVLSAIVILVINILAGMQVETISNYLTSLLMPMLAILLAFPINHYVRKFIYNRYSK